MCQNRKIKQSFKNINSTHFRNSLYSSDTCQYWLTETNKKGEGERRDEELKLREENLNARNSVL